MTLIQNAVGTTIGAAEADVAGIEVELATISMKLGVVLDVGVELNDTASEDICVEDATVELDEVACEEIVVDDSVDIVVDDDVRSIGVVD